METLIKLTSKPDELLDQTLKTLEPASGYWMSGATLSGFCEIKSLISRVRDTAIVYQLNFYTAWQLYGS